MSSIQHRRPAKTLTVYRIRYGSTGGYWHGLNNSFRDNYVAKFTGFIRITRAGRYTFWTNSDDGSRLYINNRLIVNNDGLHGMRTVAGSIPLRPGVAAVAVYFFERGGGAGVIVDWAGPGFRRRPLDGSSVTTYRTKGARVKTRGVWRITVPRCKTSRASSNRAGVVRVRQSH